MNSYTLSFENLVASAFVVNYQNCFENRFISYKVLNKFEERLLCSMNIRVCHSSYSLGDLYGKYGHYFYDSRHGISLNNKVTVNDLTGQFEVLFDVINIFQKETEIEEEDFSVGARIAKFRESKGMTQREVARKIGRTPAAICKWESGERTPGVKDIINLCILFGITADKLIIIPS